MVYLFRLLLVLCKCGFCNLMMRDVFSQTRRHIINPMQQGPHWMTNRLSTIRRILRIWSKPNVHYCVRWNPPAIPLSSHIIRSAFPCPLSFIRAPIPPIFSIKFLLLKHLYTDLLLYACHSISTSTMSPSKCLKSSEINLLAPELLFLILAHPVYKMWIIQEPNTL